MRFALLLLLALPLPAHAFERITSRDTFLAVVNGRELVGSGISMQVWDNGQITGGGLGLKVSGDWGWENGLFCRTLQTTAQNFPRDCQTVARRGQILRFQANGGRGNIADLQIR